jgi:predicted MPP superfamily phosphohydrolase
LAWPYGRLLRRTLTLSEAEIPLAGLAPAFVGTRVLLISDVHAGPFLRPRDLEQAFDRLSALEPDLILLGGDLTTARTDDLAGAGPAFRRLKAPLGVFAVLGNHDHYTGDVQHLQRMLADWGIETLHNRSVPLRRNGQSLSLAGVDDLLMGQPDLSSALHGAEPPVILLSHNPDLFFEAARAGVALMLSGHTHAGQIRIPGLPVLVRQSRYRLDQGRYRAGGTELVVSRGLGAVGLPWRAACPPEAVWLTLRRGRD